MTAISYFRSAATFSLLCLSILGGCGPADSADNQAVLADTSQKERGDSINSDVPSLPEGINADLSRQWGEGWADRYIPSITQSDLNEDGVQDYLLFGFCGSSGACAGYVYRQEANGSFTRLLETGTGEEGFVVLPSKTNGYRDLQVPLESRLFRFDGQRYVERSAPG